MPSRRNRIRRRAPGVLLAAMTWTVSTLIPYRFLGSGLHSAVGRERDSLEERKLELRENAGCFTSGCYDFGSRRFYGRCNNLALVSLFICGRSYT